MHPNEKLVREADEAMMRGDMEGYWAAHAPDVITHIAGKSQLSGTYKGLDQLNELFGRFVGAVGEFTFEPHDYLASDHHVVVLQTSHYRRDDVSLDTSDTFIFHIADGKIAELWMSSFEQDDFDRFVG